MRLVALSAAAMAAVFVPSLPAYAQLAPEAGPTQPPPLVAPTALPLTLQDALKLARQSGPAARVAPSWAREAEAGRVEASIYPRQNPLLELELGPRLLGDELKSVVLGVGLSQTLDLGGGAGAREKRVDAEVAAALGEGEAAVQAGQRAVALAFYRALWAKERVALAAEAETIAKTVLDATRKRLEAGDATALQINVARGGFARAVADRTGAEATLETATGELRALLGLPVGAPIAPTGSLAAPLAASSASVVASSKERGELRALAAEVDAAEADAALAGALAAPQLSLGARYGYEDGSQHTVLGTLALTLPIFDHAQGLAAKAKARLARAELELGAKKAQLDAELDTAAKVVDKRASAVSAYAAEGGVESFAENVALAMKGYQAGETSLGDVLLLRRELIDTEASRIDRLLELRIAEVELLHAAGVAP